MPPLIAKGADEGAEEEGDRTEDGENGKGEADSAVRKGEEEEARADGDITPMPVLFMLGGKGRMKLVLLLSASVGTISDDSSSIQS